MFSALSFGEKVSIGFIIGAAILAGIFAAWRYFLEDDEDDVEDDEP